MFTNSYIQEIQILFEDFIQKLHVYGGIENGFGSDLKEYFNDMYSCFGCGEFILEAQNEAYLECELNYVTELKTLTTSKGFDIGYDRSKKTMIERVFDVTRD